MSDIGKFAASAVGFSNELTVAAAAFNIDFSLLKVEAPKEYDGLRSVLSNHRLKEAEEGQPHIIARRLGALFETLVQPMPNFIKAYGSRVSEISSSIKDSKHYKPDIDLLGAHGGPNGTSIWAAATSGKGAFAVHFLACMLARIWKSPQAISLWVEIVESRKQEIISNFQTSNSSEMSSVMASQQIFSRKELALWDASARSWLQTADSTKRIQHTQLMLIMNNLRMPVNSIKDPYQSVVKAWISSMNAMERIVQGIPQRVQDGAILLAISSWHLYPDMEVLVDEAKTIHQKDPLMKNALITLSAEGLGNREGVFWSLPLSRLQFYSPSVLSEGRVASDTSRVSMKEFHIVLLGTIIGGWTERLSPDESCEVILLIYGRLKESDDCYEMPPWFVMMATAAESYLRASGTTQQQYSKLLNLGLRQSTTSKSSDVELLPQVPNILDTHFTLVSLLSILGEGQRSIKLCRKLGRAFDSKLNPLLIKYKLSLGNRAGKIQLSDDAYGYATVSPLTRASLKRAAQGDDDTLSSLQHCRFANGNKFVPQTDPAEDEILASLIGDVESHREGDTWPVLCELSNDVGYCLLQPLIPCRGCENRLIMERTKRSDEDFCFLDSTEWDFTYHCGDPTTYSFVYARRRAKRLHEDKFTWYSLDQDFEDTPTIAGSSLAYDDLYGLTGDLPQQTTFSKVYKPPGPVDTVNIAKLHQMADIFSSDALDVQRLQDWVTSWWASSEEFSSYIKALAMADSIYDNLDGATVNLAVLRAGIHQSHWINALETTLPAAPSTQRYKDSISSWSLPTLFSCIAMFESGEFNIAPEHLQGVMALSIGDSIYMASALLLDPSVSVGASQPQVQRCLGSLGRSDMAFLIPPATPRLRQFDLKDWKMVNHHPFDGTFQNSFASTSLHLSFTEYEIPIDVGQRGLRDTQVVLLEALISVIDRGTHIGDLNILVLFDGSGQQVSMTNQLTIRQACGCSAKSREARNIYQDNLVSLDCWDEVLEMPRKVGIFRAYGNWQARLAGTAVSIQQGKQTLVLAPDSCLRCLGTLKYLLGFDRIIA
jgi:hypothetical protein